MFEKNHSKQGRYRNNNFKNDDNHKNNELNIVLPTDTNNPTENNESNIPNDNSNYIPREFEKWDDIQEVISTDLLRGIYSYGFDNPSPIQRKSLLTIFD